MRRNINVVHIVEDMALGGLEKILCTIVLNLSKEKYNVSVWCLKEGGFFANKLISEGVEVRILHITTSRNPINIYKLYKLLKNHRFDIVHSHAYSAGTIGRISAFFAGVPVIISHNHSAYDHYNKYYNLVEWFLSYITDKIICVSEDVKRFANMAQRIHPEKLLVIYNGIEDICAVTEERSLSIKEELNIPITHPVVCTISHMEEHKGIKYLIESASLLLQLRKDVSFLIVGRGSLMEELKKLSVTLKIDKTIIFAGERSDIPEILSITDIFVLPSLREGLGLSILEAMSCGKPIIATNVGGVPEIVNDGVSGILVPPKNAETLCDAVGKLLNDKDKLINMGFNSKKIYDEGFGSKTMVSKIEELYDFLLKKKVGYR